MRQSAEQPHAPRIAVFQCCHNECSHSGRPLTSGETPTVIVASLWMILSRNLSHWMDSVVREGTDDVAVDLTRRLH